MQHWILGALDREHGGPRGAGGIRDPHDEYWGRWFQLRVQGGSGTGLDGIGHFFHIHMVDLV